MRRLVLVLALICGFAGVARAVDPEQQIRGVISDQIAAFGSNDLDRAFSHASPTIRQMFGSPTSFGRMVAQGYPMIWRPAGIRFAGITERDGHRVQSVEVTDRSGALYIADYDMIPTGDGWQINGVEIHEAEGTGV